MNNVDLSSCCAVQCEIWRQLIHGHPFASRLGVRRDGLRIQRALTPS